LLKRIELSLKFKIVVVVMAVVRQLLIDFMAYLTRRARNRDIE